ncbi:MAG: hypothetical protein R6X33_02265 [Candidatus Brocadiia bacterium]
MSDSLAVVEDLAVLDDGTVWVQNSVEPLFVDPGPASPRSGPGVVA